MSDTHTPVAPILRLPEELVTAVFAHLEYFDLRRVERVCKRFGAIMQAPELKFNLFRQGPSVPLQPGQTFKQHPLLIIVDCVGLHTRRPDHAFIRSWGLQEAGEDFEERRLNAFDYAAADEYATEPAACKIRVLMQGRDLGTLQASTGVTVRMVVEKSLAFWTAPLEDALADRLRLDHPWLEQTGKILAIDTQGDHCWFEGFWQSRVEKDGTVRLDAPMFGS